MVLIDQSLCQPISTDEGTKNHGITRKELLKLRIYLDRKTIVRSVVLTIKECFREKKASFDEVLSRTEIETRKNINCTV